MTHTDPQLITEMPQHSPVFIVAFDPGQIFQMLGKYTTQHRIRNYGAESRDNMEHKVKLG